MKIVRTNALKTDQKETIRYLWNREYPQQLAVTPESFDQFLASAIDPYHLLVIDDAGEVGGWACTFNRDGGRWFTIIINNLYQRIGLGRTLLQLLKERESHLNGWVIDHDLYIKQNGEVYSSPLSFYVQNGFIPEPQIRYEDHNISAIKIAWRKGGD